MPQKHAFLQGEARKEKAGKQAAAHRLSISKAAYAALTFALFKCPTLSPSLSPCLHAHQKFKFLAAGTGLSVFEAWSPPDKHDSEQLTCLTLPSLCPACREKREALPLHCLGSFHPRPDRGDSQKHLKCHMLISSSSLLLYLTSSLCPTSPIIPCK